MNRLRGLKALVQDAVDQGSRAVERLQKETMRRPLEIIAQIPPLEVPGKGILEIHDLAVTNTHAVVRLVNRVVFDTVGVLIDIAEKRQSLEKNRAKNESASMN
jgi:hypothetical protein